MEYYVDRYRVASGVMRHDNPNRKDDYLMSSHQNTKYADGDWFCVCSSSAAQKIKKLSETPVTVHNIAKLCVIDGKSREIRKK